MIALKPTLVVEVPAHDPAVVLQMLALQRATGAARLCGEWLLFDQGAIVAASRTPATTVRAMTKLAGRFEFQTLPGSLTGITQAASVEGLLLEAARLDDEEGR